MQFLVDECTGPAVAAWLAENGYETASVYDETPGISDDEVIERANSEHRILITNDKDFGEKIYRERHPHTGVILLRLSDERAANKIEVLKRLLRSHAGDLPGRFVVVSDSQVRFAPRSA